MIGILLAFFSWVFVSISNVLTKKISVNWNIEKSLLFQYLLVCFFSFFFFIFDSYNIVYSNLFFILIIISGIFGYFGIWGLMNGFSKLQSGVNIIVSHMYVFLGYFVNYLIFPDIEGLSIIKILFAIMFFVIICFFVLEKSGNKIEINKYIIFPVITAISWTVFYAIGNYLIKSHYLSSLQNTFISSLSILFFSVIFIIISQKSIKINFNGISKKSFIWYVLRAITITIGMFGIFLAYKYISGNIVNLIGLFNIILTPLLIRIFFGDKLSKKQIILFILAFIDLGLFVFI